MNKAYNNILSYNILYPYNKAVLTDVIKYLQKNLFKVVFTLINTSVLIYLTSTFS